MKTNHTPEPWIHCPCGKCGELWNQDMDIKILQTNWVTNGIHNLEDAHRIVACVNACKGITTEELENVGPGNLKNFLEDS